MRPRYALLLLPAALGCGPETRRVETAVAGFAEVDGGGEISGGDGTVGADSGTDDGAGGGPVCTEGASRCAAAGRQRCAAGAWQPSPCAAATPACVLGACRACAPGALRCGGDGRERCDDGGAWQPLPCPPIAPVCEAGACRLCVPGQTFCTSDGAVAAVAVCAASGQDTESLQACPAGVACKDGHCQLCAPTSTRCHETARQRCIAAGDGWVATPCPADAPFCVEGGCAPCAPGSLRCVTKAVAPGQGPPLAAVERCSEDGQSWQLETACPAGAVCHDNTCKTCAPGSAVCVGSTVATCKADGSGRELGVDCAASFLGCTAGACSCSEGFGVCAPPLPGAASSSAVLVCAGGKANAIMQICPPGGACAAGCLVCQEGAGACVGDVLGSCIKVADTPATAYDTANGKDCGASGQICRQGACVDACAPDQNGESGCSAVGFDLPRASKGPADPAPSPTAAPATLHLVARAPASSAVATTITQLQVGGLAATPPTATATLGGAIALPLASLGKLPAQAPIVSGQTAPIALQWSAGGDAYLDAGSADGSDGQLVRLPPPKAPTDDFVVVGWPGAGVGAEAWLAVVNHGGPCQLELHAAGAIQASPPNAPGLAVPALAAGTSWTTTLPAQALLLLVGAPDADLTGSTVACAGPISVLVGHRGLRLPQVGSCSKPEGAGPFAAGTCVGTGGVCVSAADCPPPCCADAVATAALPVQRWGHVYVVARSAARGAAPDALRVVAKVPGTLVATVPPVGPPALLGPGQALDLLVSHDVVVVATADIAVVQGLVGRGATGLGAAATGDPAIAWLPPIGRWRETWPLLAPQAGYSAHHLAIAAPVGAVVTLDGGAPLPLQPIPLTIAKPGGKGDAKPSANQASGFATTSFAVGAGPHLVRCRPACQVVAHGYGAAAGYAE